jgi:small subunit ribosomal protein S6
MTLPAPTYDLMMLLDPKAEEDARAKILADTRASISADGEVVRDDSWGDRALAYPIDRHGDAEYHLLQFKPGRPELLDELGRTLHITDGVLRFRIIKLKPGTPEAPAPPPGAVRPPQAQPAVPTLVPARVPAAGAQAAPPPADAPAGAPAPPAAEGPAPTADAPAGEPAAPAPPAEPQPASPSEPAGSDAGESA